MTQSAWFGVTPEPVALAIAQHTSTAPPNKTIVIDAFAGVGGNAIAYALSRRWERVFAVERDAETLECARRNAAIYGVGEEITWIHGDAFEVLRERLRDVAAEAVVFASPPWGGELGVIVWSALSRGLNCIDVRSRPDIRGSRSV